MRGMRSTRKSESVSFSRLRWLCVVCQRMPVMAGKNTGLTFRLPVPALVVQHDPFATCPSPFDGSAPRRDRPGFLHPRQEGHHFFPLVPPRRCQRRSRLARVSTPGDVAPTRALARRCDSEHAREPGGGVRCRWWRRRESELAVRPRSAERDERQVPRGRRCAGRRVWRRPKKVSSRLRPAFFFFRPSGQSC